MADIQTLSDAENFSLEQSLIDACLVEISLARVCLEHAGAGLKVLPSMLVAKGAGQ